MNYKSPALLILLILLTLLFIALGVLQADYDQRCADLGFDDALFGVRGVYCRTIGPDHIYLMLLRDALVLAEIHQPEIAPILSHEF